MNTTVLANNNTSLSSGAVSSDTSMLIRVDFERLMFAVAGFATGLMFALACFFFYLCRKRMREHHHRETNEPESNELV